MAYREEKGRFQSREELKSVKRLGDKVYEQCAGFLRIYSGKELLDFTSVHPESYEQTYRLMEKLGYQVKAIDLSNIQDFFNDIEERILAYPIKEKKSRQGKSRSFQSGKQQS